VQAILDKGNFVFNPPELGCVLSLKGLPGGSSKIYDRSPYSNIGAIVGATWIKLPNGLWCLSFDGSDDYVDCGNQNSLRFTGSFTVEAWIKRGATGGTQSVTSRYDYNGANNRAWNFYLESNYLQLLVSRDGYKRAIEKTTNTFTSTTNFYYLVGVYDSQTPKLLLYVNGALQSSTTTYAGGETSIPTSMANPATSVYLGNIPTSLDQDFSGLIALARVHTRVLSVLEIENHFNQEKHLFEVW